MGRVVSNHCSTLLLSNCLEPIALENPTPKKAIIEMGRDGIEETFGNAQNGRPATV
jgi:hypothetical protein